MTIFMIIAALSISGNIMMWSRLNQYTSAHKHNLTILEFYNVQLRSASAHISLQNKLIKELTTENTNELRPNPENNDN